MSSDDDSYSERYSRTMTKYYCINIPMSDKEKVESYVKVQHNAADIGFQRPNRSVSASSKLTVE